MDRRQHLPADLEGFGHDAHRWDIHAVLFGALEQRQHRPSLVQVQGGGSRDHCRDGGFAKHTTSMASHSVPMAGCQLAVGKYARAEVICSTRSAAIESGRAGLQARDAAGLAMAVSGPAVRDFTVVDRADAERRRRTVYGRSTTHSSARLIQAL